MYLKNFLIIRIFRFRNNNTAIKKKKQFSLFSLIQNDIYHLHAFGKGSERVYCGIAYIQNYNISKMMNSTFRNIKENQNLDALEESDDEEDFEDCRIDKYVDLDKKCAFECVYLHKFRRWCPIRQINGKGQIVHIRQL